MSAMTLWISRYNDLQYVFDGADTWFNFLVTDLHYD